METAYLEKQKQRLLDMRGRLREEINRMMEVVLEEERPTGEHERVGVPSESADKEIHLENTEESIGRAVNAALERIERGTYGTCESCRRPIAKVRLDAIPYADRCSQCARKLERV